MKVVKKLIYTTYYQAAVCETDAEPLLGLDTEFESRSDFVDDGGKGAKQQEEGIRQVTYLLPR